MLKKEFEVISKTSVTEEEYDRINAIYMDIQLDKIEFCKSWNGNRDVIIDLMHVELCSTDRKLIEERNNLKNALSNIAKEKDEILSNLIDFAEKTSSMEIRDYAVSISSQKQYIVAKLNKDYELWKDELEWVLEMLQEIELKKQS